MIQENREDRRTVLGLQDILTDLGVPWLGINIDFASKTLPQITGLDEDDRVLCHGPSFIPRIDHSDPFWRIGSIFDPKTFLWSQCRAHWGELMLARGSVSSVQDFAKAVSDGPVFIRPDADSKVFDGGVRSTIELKELLARLPEDLQIVSAPPETIDAEYRVFVVGDDVVAASQYRLGGKPASDGFVPSQVIDLALQANALWQPREAYVIDIAKSGTRFGVIEVNCITAARFYSADARAVVAALCAYY